jgi:hypothetical protein
MHDLSLLKYCPRQVLVIECEGRKPSLALLFLWLKNFTKEKANPIAKQISKANIRIFIIFIFSLNIKR